MKMTRFFFEYFLEVECGGNKSLCARELSLGNRRGVYTALERFEHGGGIGATAEFLLQRLVERKVSLDWLVQIYMTPKGARENRALCPGMATLDAAREHWRQSMGAMSYYGRDVCGKLDDLAEQVAHVYCVQNRCPGIEHIYDGQCVCEQLAGIMRLMCETFEFEDAGRDIPDDEKQSIRAIGKGTPTLCES